MGQKTHPKGFRLVTTQKHLSSWYSEKSHYPTLLEEDAFFRQKVETMVKDFLNLSSIEIFRSGGEEEKDQRIHILLKALYPRQKEMSKKLIDFLKEEKIFGKKLQKQLVQLRGFGQKAKLFAYCFLKYKMRQVIRTLKKQSSKRITIGIDFIRNPFEKAIFIAKMIGDQLQRRIPYRRIVKQILKKGKKTVMKGIKIELSGRLNGVEMARSEWKREGKIPLHTLRTNIDYTHYKIQTIYGIMGIKVWLLKSH